MPRATIVRWFPERGYGFAKPHSSGGRDVLVHAAHIKEGVPFVGADIAFELFEGKQGKRQANKVRVLSRITP